MTRDLRKILKMLAEKYPEEQYGIVALIIYDDETGRITNNVTEAYDYAPLFEFVKGDGGVDGLVKHLQEK